MNHLQRRDLFKAFGLIGAGSLLAAHATPASARGIDVQTTTVFERFEGGYHTFRGPNPVRTKGGTLLAFANGKAGAADFEPAEPVLKRSHDGGRTWGPIEVVVSAAPATRVSGSPVVDLRGDRVLLIVVVIELEVDPRPAPRAFVLHSDDEGRTWSDWREITDQVALPTWEHYVIGPPHGIQLEHGPHAGRLVFPGWFRRLPPQDGNPVVGGAYLTYSDDGGQTWHIGAVDERGDGLLNPSESGVVELGDGTLYVNTRNQRASKPEHRAEARSSDGGETFSMPFEVVPELETPFVSASLLEATRPSDARERILFCSEDHPSSRDRLMLWSSPDGAKTWHKSLLVYDGPAGYTDLVDVEDGVVGVMAETGPRLSSVGGGLSYHERLTFSRVRLSLLDRPALPRVITPDESGKGNHGLVSGSPGVVGGRRKQAFELAGDYVEVPLNDALTVGSGAFTVAVWFRTGSDENQRIANAYNYGGGNAYWAIDLTPRRLRAQLRTDADVADLRSGTDYTDGRWHHVALRWGGRDVATLYIEGEAVDVSEPISGSVSAAAFAPIRIGARVDGINNPFVGAMDDFVFYDRGLPSSAITALAAGHAPPADDEHLLVHLPLDNRRG